MKKLLVVVSLIMVMGLFLSNSVQSQTNTFPATGSVGIGTLTPAYILDVRQNGVEPKLSITNAGGTGGAAFRMFDQGSGTDWRFKAAAVGTFKIRDNFSGKDVLTFEKGTGTANSIYVTALGNVGIGTNAPGAKLAVNGAMKVNGKINATEIEVSLTAWPDHVFKSGFELMPLQDVENYISLNKHLPGVPSETDVIQKGNNLGEMDAILLQKIEELTLYMIDLKKENDQLKKLIAK
ncbi:MAG: hypothetical protein M0Q38_16050 [Bacteroidales bacterium]|jgi:hypothetical protein|nr:hypothetical protein [Bacteroidales bacterium]